MGGVWGADGEGTWWPLPASGFAAGADLHDLIEQTPEMLPLAGSPRLAILGREVELGRGWADLLAVETTTGRPVIIEIKLAANTDRRQVLTQVSATLHTCAGWMPPASPHRSRRICSSGS